MCEKKVGSVYAAKDDWGNFGIIRHAIWSDVLRCSDCNSETSFWEAAVRQSPVSIAQRFKCPKCGLSADFDEVDRAYESFED
jgi:hypothetical protein